MNEWTDKCVEKENRQLAINNGILKHVPTYVTNEMNEIVWKKVSVRLCRM